MALRVGERIGDYEIIAELGAGGMARVYKVRNTISQQIEAMKIMLPDLAGEASFSERFLHEIQVLATLDHPGIARLHTALRIENQLVMIMELVEGVTLEGLLKQGRIPVAEGIDYTCQALSALSYAHRKGIIHRDIKPANMMRTPDGTMKLMDFGIAKTQLDSKLTRTGNIIGSIAYMSPEQVMGTGGVTVTLTNSVGTSSSASGGVQ
jgi:serine/threonine-protein kinase